MHHLMIRSVLVYFILVGPLTTFAEDSYVRIICWGTESIVVLMQKDASVVSAKQLNPASFTWTAEIKVRSGEAPFALLEYDLPKGVTKDPSQDESERLYGNPEKTIEAINKMIPKISEGAAKRLSRQLIFSKSSPPYRGLGINLAAGDQDTTFSRSPQLGESSISLFCQKPKNVSQSEIDKIVIRGITPDQQDCNDTDPDCRTDNAEDGGMARRSRDPASLTKI